MKGQDTSQGTGGQAFPGTTWSLFSRADGPEGGRRVALETLCRRYWKPVYHYVRSAWTKSNEDAKDLTQGFLTWLLEESPLEKYDPALGSFRGFLKVLLRRFVGHQERALQRIRRGGAVRILPLEADAGLDDVLPDPSAADPEQAFDRAWVAEVVNRAFERVRTACAGGPRATALAVYEAYDPIPESERPSYAELAQRFAMTLHQVQTILRTMREEIRKAIQAELSDTTADGKGMEEEWNALF